MRDMEREWSWNWTPTKSSCSIYLSPANDNDIDDDNNEMEMCAVLSLLCRRDISSKQNSKTINVDERERIFVILRHQRQRERVLTPTMQLSQTAATSSDVG